LGCSMKTAIRRKHTPASLWLVLAVMLLSVFSFSAGSTGSSAKMQRTTSTEVLFTAKRYSKHSISLKGFSVAKSHHAFISYFRISSFAVQLKQYSVSVINTIRNLHVQVLSFVSPDQFLTRYFTPRSAVEGTSISLLW
jgi:hypothetical protein